MMKIKRSICTFIVAAIAISMLSANAFAASSDSKAGQVATSSTALNVRNSASASSTIVAKLPKDSFVTLVLKTGSWWKVEYAEGKYGYCSSAYIREIEESYMASVNVSSGNLNVRGGASTAYAIQSKLVKGTGVVVLSSQNGWSKVLYDGTQVGYVSSAYLYVKSSTSYKAISLNVPTYRQMDSRWANVMIGTSGQTIGQIGCTTTCLSMTESYRLGTAVYPNQMEQRLSYTSGGALYWPSNYATSTSTDYLKIIYAQLEKGIPVIIGSKNVYGGAHWVVITGYTGGETLTASGFTINDPGTASRTNLQHLFNSYPNFHRIAYYL
ncbi:MAG: hypothetical protein EOM05_00040 [Clostridia bacterium]|nr:hypothetical protein [Clostridia bacterium]